MVAHVFTACRPQEQTGKIEIIHWDEPQSIHLVFVPYPTRCEHGSPLVAFGKRLRLCDPVSDQTRRDDRILSFSELIKPFVVAANRGIDADEES